MKHGLKGVYTALVTPFDESGHLNEAIFSRFVNWQIEEGVDGLVVLGATGEVATLTSEERRRLIELTVHLAKGRVPVLVGTGTSSTRETIERTLEAKMLGSDGAMIITPYFNRPTQEGIYRHFEAINHATHFPFILYNTSGRSGRNVEVKTIERLSTLEWFKGVKESCGNFDQLMQLQLIPHLSIMTGDDSWTLPAIATGATGVISVASNLIPRRMKRWVDQIFNGHFAEALHEHKSLLTLFDTLFIESNPTPIKEALAHFGWNMGAPRLPLCPLEEKNKERLLHVLRGIKP